MKAIIIDLSSPGAIKVLNVRITSIVNVSSGFFLPYQPNQDLFATIAAKLNEEGMLSIPAIIIPPSDLVKKLNIPLPKMPDKEIRKILPREIATAADSNEPMIFNYLKNGIIEDRQVEKMEISTVYCEEQKMNEFLTQLKNVGIHVIHIIPMIQGLKTLASLNHAFGTEKTGAVFLEMIENRISLNIFRNKYWALEREFMFRMERLAHDEDLLDEDFTRISTELNRTFQYFKQRNRGFAIDQILLYGASNTLTNLKNLINDNHPVTASVVQLEHFGGKLVLPPYLANLEEFLNLFAVSLATAIAVSAKNPLDLYPREFQEKTRVFSRVLGLTISTILIATILLASVFYFEGIKNSYKNDVKAMEKTYQVMSKNSNTIMDTKIQRTDVLKRRYYLDYPARYGYAAADFVRQLSLITNPNIELLQLEMNPAGQVFKFTLEGRILAEDNVRAQSQFLLFFQQVKELDYMANVSSSKITVNPNDSSSSSANMALATTQKESILYFSMDGEVEVE